MFTNERLMWAEFSVPAIKWHSLYHEVLQYCCHGLEQARDENHVCGAKAGIMGRENKYDKYDFWITLFLLRLWKILQI